jgi:hypothetical protein
LPTTDKSLKGELNALSPAPGGIKLFTGVKIDAHIVDLY